MSAKEHDEHGAHLHPTGAPHEDNHDAAYAPSAEAGPVRPATPAHGYWRSLAELEGKAKLQTERGDNELPPAPEVVDPLSRRSFFQLMGASMALAGATRRTRSSRSCAAPRIRSPARRRSTPPRSSSPGWATR